MALRRDYSLTKDLDFHKDKDFYTLPDEYEEAPQSGRTYKPSLTYLLKIYQGVCGEGDEIEKIYSLYGSYASVNVTDMDYIVSGETALLKDLYAAICEYGTKLEDLNEDLSRMIDGWLASVNPNALTPDEKKEDMQYVGQVELVLNRRIFLYESKKFLESLIRGNMQETDYPHEEDDPDSPSTAINLPVMTHVPWEADIDASELVSDPLMQVLYNIVRINADTISKMFHDYDNGSVCVRLWTEEDGVFEPCFFSVSKSDVYLNKVTYLNQRAIWPGLIEAAVKLSGCPYEKPELVKLLLGPECEAFGMDYLIGPNEPPQEESSTEFNELVHAYEKCFFDIYSMLLLTNSLVIEDEPAYVRLMLGIKEMLYVLTTCLCRTFDEAASAIKSLRQLMDEYKKNVDDSANTAATEKKRLAVCETLGELLDLLENEGKYHDNPRGYFAQTLATQVAKVLLTSLRKPVTSESVAEKAAMVMKDKVFKQKISKMNIHALKHSTPKMAETVLAAMERR